ncbi:putative cell morphogenesis protein [Phaeomoniella chlamydospora]|uniref:Putative cell morphogenesis protein n=1 Tax=Phaeomoniella chlamydospora TaxID=158046 RepID=A0A0G2GK42_PHACM|nr:putative cell morphogenesis protein [Phaeomoniella chlamydospora]
MLASSQDTLVEPDQPSIAQNASTAESQSAPTQPADQGPKPITEVLSAEATIEKTRIAVEEGRKITQDALAGSEAVSEVVRPKLTIDLGHSKIARLPEPVVDLIKDEVERLSLSHNQIWHIPYRFEECAQLRYLNIRTNNFREFPRAVYKLPLLEILDISRNKLRRVPEEIRQLTSLRVFSLMHNRVDDLPTSLCDMNKLQILKVAENPLRFRLRRVVDQKEQEVANTTLTDNEKELAITVEIKRFLQDERRGQIMTTPTPADAESGGEASEIAIDTPRPLKRYDEKTRLSSVPEQKEDDMVHNPLVEGAKGILYAIYQVHPQLSTLTSVAKSGDLRRNSIEIIWYTASAHIDQLNEVLENANIVYEDEEYRLDSIESAIKTACMRCIKSYTALCLQIQEYVPKIISRSDARYVRTTMLLLYGSIVEIKNACTSFGVDLQHPVANLSIDNSSPPTAVEQTLRAPRPIQDQSVSRPGARQRSDTAIQHPTLNTIITETQNMAAQQTPIFTQSLNMTGSTVNGTIHSGASLGPSAFTGTTLGNRSRSNSRATPISSVPSSVTGTPPSVDTFLVPQPGVAPSRINTLTGVSEAEEDRVFEEIFRALSRAYNAADQSLPITRRYITRSLEAANENRHPKEIRDMWSHLTYRCKACMDLSEALHSRLVNMKVKDPVAGRNQREFWALCKSFLQSFVNLVVEMRDAGGKQLLPAEAVYVLRPVQKACRDAGKLIDASPWNFLADDNSTSSMPTPLAQYPGGSGYSATGFPPPSQAANGISPVSVPLPATPLSAALGPAVQATVPSTPASAYGDQFFAGNVFQRADSLLSMQQAAGFPLYSRRA